MTGRARRASRLALALAALLGGSGCAPARTAPPGFVESNERTLLEPSRLEWFSAEQQTSELPGAIALGGAAAGRQLLYLEFAATVEPRAVLGAELLLSSLSTHGQAVALVLSRAEPPRARRGGPSGRPRALEPRSAAHFFARAWPERLDVTEMARARSKADEPLRLLVRAEPSDDDGAEGVLLATGAAGGSGPKLEIYWQ